jgi:hypothetical protein
VATQVPPQQSPFAAQVSPARRQPGAASWHWPPVQTPPQQSLGAEHGCPIAPHETAPQVASVPWHPSEQQAPARAHA